VSAASLTHDEAGRPGRLNAAGSQADWPGRRVRLPASRLRRGTRCSAAEVQPPEILPRRELILAAWVVQPPDREFAALTVDQPEEPPGGQRLGNIFGDCLAGPGLADCGRLGPVVAGDRILGDDPAVRRAQGGELRDQRIGNLIGFQLLRWGPPPTTGSGRDSPDPHSDRPYRACYPCLADYAPSPAAGISP